MAGSDNIRHPSNPYPYTLPGVMIESPNIQDPYGYLATVYNNDPAIVQRITDLETRLMALQEKVRKHLDEGSTVDQVVSQMQSHVRALERDRSALTDRVGALEAQVKLLGAWREAQEGVYTALREDVQQALARSSGRTSRSSGLLATVLDWALFGFLLTSLSASTLMILKAVCK